MPTYRTTPVAALARNLTPEYLSEIGEEGTNWVPVARGGIPVNRQKFALEITADGFAAAASMPVADCVTENGRATWSMSSVALSTTCGGYDFETGCDYPYAGRDKSAMRWLHGNLSSDGSWGEPSYEHDWLYVYLRLSSPMSPWLGVRGADEGPADFPEGYWAIRFFLSLEPHYYSPSSWSGYGSYAIVSGTGWLRSAAAFRRIGRPGRAFSPWRLDDRSDVDVGFTGGYGADEIPQNVLDFMTSSARAAWLSVAANIGASIRVLYTDNYNIGPLEPR